jgi:DNA repair exonuclease SbcCD ATPase subunit
MTDRTEPAAEMPVHGCTIGGQPAMPVLVSEYNQLTADLARYEEVLGELNDTNIGLARQAARAEADLAALRQVARGYCPACGRGDAAPTVDDWERERQRAENAEAERDTARRDVEIFNKRIKRLTDGYTDQFRRLEAAEAALDRVRGYAEHCLRTGRESAGGHLLTLLDTDPMRVAATRATDGGEQP